MCNIYVLKKILPQTYIRSVYLPLLRLYLPDIHVSPTQKKECYNFSRRHLEYISLFCVFSVCTTQFTLLFNSLQIKYDLNPINELFLSVFQSDENIVFLYVEERKFNAAF